MSRGRNSGCGLVGRAIRLARELRGITQHQLARVLGDSRSAVAAYETGAKGVPVSQLARIADACAVDFRGVEFRYSAHHIEKSAWAPRPVVVTSRSTGDTRQ